MENQISFTHRKWLKLHFGLATGTFTIAFPFSKRSADALLRVISITFFLSLLCTIGFAQNRRIDSLKHELVVAKQDTNRVLVMAQLCNFYRSVNPDSAQFYAQRALALARKINFPKGMVRALTNWGRVINDSGNLPKALQMQFEALQIAEENGLTAETGWPLNRIGSIYATLRDSAKAKVYRQRAMKVFTASHDVNSILVILNNMGVEYTETNQLDSALYYFQQVYTTRMKGNLQAIELNYLGFGNAYLKKKKYPLALDYFRKANQVCVKTNNHREGGGANCRIAQIYQKLNQPDSSIYYAKKGLAEAQLISYKQGILESGLLLSELYESIDTKESFRYYKLAVEARESLFGAGNMQAIQTMIADDETRRKEVEDAKIEYQNQLKQYALLAGLGMVVLIALLLYRNNLREKKAKNLLREQKEKVETTLSQLKSTQAQLIQKEKLASLGELTAGIAHEIQNPLNFVNNFSEVSEELVEELEEEQQKTKRDPELEADLLGDLKQNLQKINHHGKRASSIVKGMLEHSRTGTGERQLADINQLADEYLRLSYHGLRAKYSRFNSDYELITDEHLPNIEVVPQEIGRVLLNLINNAFYAVNERAKQAETDYQPKVTILTKTNDNQIEIRVQDNGNGIPDSIKSKIFQPFFTTKPTGEGTGLGLSLAYDIVTKGHGGTLEVETKEGVGTTFIVKLPIQSN
jgi:two-component system NtrC family sensor kinase